MRRTTFLMVALCAGLCSGLPAQEALQDLGQQLDLPLPPPALDAPDAQENGYLGMSVFVPDADAATVYIESVVPGGPAAQAGLVANDVIVAVNGQAIRGLADLDPFLRQPPGAKLVFQVRRGGLLRSVTATLAPRAATPAPPPPPADSEPVVDELPPPPTADMPLPPALEAPSSTPESVRPSLGITVADVGALSVSDRRRYVVSVDAGAVIRGIREGSPAALAGLPLGGVIVAVNGQRVESAQDVVDLVSSFEPGQEIEIAYWDGDRKGHKQVRLGSARVTVSPAPPSSSPDARPPADTVPRVRPRDGDRPILNALERLLDNVVPPPVAAPEQPERTPPPPPPLTEDQPFSPPPDRTMVIPPPPPPAPGLVDSPGVEFEPPAELEADTDTSEVQALRRQIEQLQKQLETLLRRVEELEKKTP